MADSSFARLGPRMGGGNATGVLTVLLCMGLFSMIFAEVIMTAQPLLDVNDLTVEFSTRRGIVKAVQHVNISVAKGETLGIVGESGSGKSVTSYAVMRILDRAGRIAEGSVMFSGIDVKAATENQMRDLRGREISMIFQNPRAALNPIRKVGDQIEDVLRQHVQSRGQRPRREGDRGAGAGQDRPSRASAITPIRSNFPAACASAS